MNQKVSPLTTGVFLGCGFLFLAPIVSDLYERKPLPEGSTILFVLLAAILFFLAGFPYLSPRRKTMVDKAVTAIRTGLDPVARSGWAWFLLILVFFGYLAAEPIADYYTQRLAFHTTEENAEVARERAQYQGQIDDRNRQINDLQKQLADSAKYRAATGQTIGTIEGGWRQVAKEILDESADVQNKSAKTAKAQRTYDAAKAGYDDQMKRCKDGAPTSLFNCERSAWEGFNDYSGNLTLAALNQAKANEQKAEQKLASVPDSLKTQLDSMR
jgi:hypothetical protein